MVTHKMWWSITNFGTERQCPEDGEHASVACVSAEAWTRLETSRGFLGLLVGGNAWCSTFDCPSKQSCIFVDGLALDGLVSTALITTPACDVC